MATLKQRLHRKNSSGTYDVIHFETEWSCITGKPSTFKPASHTHGIDQITNLQTSLNGKANSSHTHTTDQINGILPVEKGGTGQTTIDGLKTELGINSANSNYQLQVFFGELSSSNSDIVIKCNSGLEIKYVLLLPSEFVSGFLSSVTEIDIGICIPATYSKSSLNARTNILVPGDSISLYSVQVQKDSEYVGIGRNGSETITIGKIDVTTTDVTVHTVDPSIGKSYLYYSGLILCQ